MTWLWLLGGAWAFWAWKAGKLPLGGAAPLSPLLRAPTATEAPVSFWDALDPAVRSGTPVGEGGAAYHTEPQTLTLGGIEVNGIAGPVTIP